jgi:POT family proton-dependent oligopeptide transporter
MEHTPGALNLGQAMATRTYCAFFILYFVTPIFIAPLADNWLGQYMTLLVSSVVYCLGCLTLTISSLPSSLDRDWGLPGFILSIVLIGLGAGGVREPTTCPVLYMLTSSSSKLPSDHSSPISTPTESLS